MNLASFDGTYCGQPVDPSDIWSQWNLDPGLIVMLVALTVLVRQRPAGLAAVAVLVLAFVSPLCALTAALFSARVVHHLIMIAIAAPLLALAFPARRPAGLWVPFAMMTATLWLWHLPVAYDLALGNTLMYWVMQASLLATAFAFWRAVLQPEQAGMSAILGIFGAYLQMALLGALLTFAPASLYAIHAVAPMAWGLTPLADQQLGGLIMWVPGGFPYLVIAALRARRGWRDLGIA